MNLMPIASQLAALSVFLQVSAFLFFAPVFSERILSARLKITVLLALCSVLFPARLEHFSSAGCSDVAHGLILVQSFAQGAVAGIALRAAIFILQILGAFLSQLSSLSQILGPSVADDMSPAMGQLILFSGLFMISAYDAHIFFIEALQNSYPLCFEINELRNRVIEAAVETGRRSFLNAFLLATPFVVLSMIYNILLGFMNRAMPQLMVAFVGAPLLVGGFLVCLFAFLPSLIIAWVNYALFLFQPG
jgi:flagellar biosynthetic protein FliR